MSLAAEYETTINRMNQVSMWDRVVESKEDAVLQLPYVRNKYKLARPSLFVHGVTVYPRL